MQLLLQNVNNNLPVEENDSTIWFSLRDSEKFNGKSTRHKFPGLIIKNQGNKLIVEKTINLKEISNIHEEISKIEIPYNSSSISSSDFF